MGKVANMGIPLVDKTKKTLNKATIGKKDIYLQVNNEKTNKDITILC